MNTRDAQALFSAYIEAALWSSNDEHGEPLDSSKYAGSEIEAASLTKLAGYCLAFLEANEADVLDAERCRAAATYGAYEQAGHDLWLTQNGHGCGFWDGDWSEPHAARLTKAASALPEVYLYVGDNGQIDCG